MIMNAIPDYFEQVYAGVLGKVIGVYMGRPFEGWTRDAIEARWGVVDHYVHHDRGVPLVVADDDISGTFTFIRALEDSGLGVETPADFFGDKADLPARFAVLRDNRYGAAYVRLLTLKE